jgi:multiple sugar transport system ATP-binding protein
MSTLSLKHLYKIYDNGTKAVNDFNLEIGENEFIVFVGPSGCGKSTTLRMIAGLEDITAGDFYIDGVLSNNLEPKDRDMAMVFQNYALYPHMSVYDNMAFGLKIKHVPKEEISKRIHEAAKILDIESQLAKKPKEMSGGQKQRVALGRAIVRKPKVFLLDEPLSNLDAKLRSSMRSEITRLHNVLGTTFIYVTHDQIEAMTMGTKIVVMESGVIKQVDTPMNLYDYPANEFVAGFIGTPQMNFYKAHLEYRGKEIAISSAFKDVLTDIDTLKKMDIVNIIKKKDITVGVRPEHIKISDKKDKNAFEVEIIVVEALGNESNLIVETVADRTRFTIRTLRNDSFAIGQRIFIALDLDHVHIFDSETKNTLLPRNPLAYSVKAKVVDKEHIELLGKKIKITPYIYEAIKDHKELLVRINQKAIKEGKDFKLDFVNKEKAVDRWIFTLKHEDEYVYYSQKEYIDGTDFEFNLRLSCLSFYSKDGELLLDEFNPYSEVEGALDPVKRELPTLNSNLLEAEAFERIKAENYLDKDGKKIKVKIKNYKVFNYKIFDKIVEPSLNHLIKIYSLLGKKFALHHIKFVVDANDVKLAEKGQFCGVISKIMDFFDEKYYYVNANGNEILINAQGTDFKENDTINFDIETDAIGVIDSDFGVRIL